MDSDYDVAIIGGAFSGAATALMLKRKRPQARILIIEKTDEFDRKVGESTTEVSSCYMTRILGLTHYLGHHQLAKQGLRLWFSNRPDQGFDDCVEVGTRYQSRLPGFQVDRAKLDSHMLDLAVEAGCELWRPAKVINLELNNGSGQRVSVARELGESTVRARWLVDATGRAAMLARKLGYFRPNTEHPINAVWARFTGVKEWDSYEWRQRFPDYANHCRTAREWATNHLFGRGWWVWIIPLQGGDVSAGIVYDSRIFKFPEGPTLGQRLHTHILSNPVGREIFGAAKVIEGDVHALSMLPYHSEKVCGDGWTAVSVLVRKPLQRQILLHGGRRVDVGRAASRCKQLLSQFGPRSLSRSGTCVSHSAFHGRPRRICPERDEFLQPTSRRLGKSQMGDWLLWKKKRRLARAL